MKYRFLPGSRRIQTTDGLTNQSSMLAVCDFNYDTVDEGNNFETFLQRLSAFLSSQSRTPGVPVEASKSKAGVAAMSCDDAGL